MENSNTKQNEDPLYWIYRAVLKREPDPKGIAWWRNHYENGMLLSDIIREFENSPEKKSMSE